MIVAMSKQRIAVVGPGGVGCFFAAHLSGTEHEVVACARRGFDRYLVESETAPFEGPATVVTEPHAVAGPFDWVLVGVKAHQTDGAAGWFERTCGPDTVVVAMQNGIEAEERLAPHVNGARVIASVVYCGAELLAPGHIRHSTDGRLIVPVGGPGERLVELFEGSAATIDMSERHLTSAWVKLGLNVIANGLTALTLQPIGVLQHPPITKVAARMLRETWTVGRAAGADLDLDDLETFVSRMGVRAAEGRTSMLADVEAGRPTEHDAIHGAVLRVAAAHDLSAPTVEAVHAILDARSA